MTGGSIDRGVSPGRVLVKLHGRCNNRCIFCHCEDKVDEHREFGDVEALLSHLPEGVNQVVLSGGEPTIYPDLERVLRLLRRRGLRIGFVSNGRMFAYPSLARKVVAAGADYFYISLHSPNARTHDSITQTEHAWDQTTTGIANLRGLSKGIEIVINCVIVRANADALAGLVPLAADVRATLLKFQVPEIKGRAVDRVHDKLLPLHQAASVVAKAMSTATDSRVPVAYDGLPLCSLPPNLRNMVNNLKTSRIFHMAEVSETSFFPTDASSRSKLPMCTRCADARRCPGFYAGYDDLGDVGSNPLKCLHPLAGKETVRAGRTPSVTRPSGAG